MSKKELNNEGKGSFKLPKHHILRGRRNFDRLFSQSEFITTTSFTLRYTIFQNESPSYLVGFVAPKRIGNAVKRARAKRLMREAYRLNQDSTRSLFSTLEYSVHYLFIARIALDDWKQVEQDVVHALQQLCTQLPNSLTQ